MKTLLLLRHAKSSWGDASLPDRERPLTGRGERAALVLGGYLAQKQLVPDAILCSPARRTRETLRRVLAQLPAPPLPRVEEDLYLASAPALLERVQALEPELGAVLVLGHNPGLEELARALAARGRETALRRFEEGLPTAGLAVIELAVDDWRAAAPDTGHLARLVRPRDLV